MRYLIELPRKIIMLNYFNYVFKIKFQTIINRWNNDSANTTDLVKNLRKTKLKYY